MFHFGWKKVDPKLIDQRFVRRDTHNVHHGSYFQVWEYMVELPGLDGRPIRLTIKEKTYNLKDPQIGDMVPILVNRKLTKAAFKGEGEGAQGPRRGALRGEAQGARVALLAQCSTDSTHGVSHLRAGCRHARRAEC